MATTTTSNLEASQRALGIYYDKIVIESLQPNLYFEQFGTIVGVPKGNYTSRFFTFNKIATADVTTLTEGTAPTGIAVSVNAIDTTPTQYGVNVELTDLVALTAVFELVNTTLTEVGKAAARKIDEVIQTVVNAGTNVIYAGGKTSRAALGAGDLFDAGLLRRAAAKLRKNAAPEFSQRGGGYVAITTPDVVFDLKSNTSVGQWLDLNLKSVGSWIKQLIQTNLVICWEILKRFVSLLWNNNKHTGTISRYPHLNLVGSAV